MHRRDLERKRRMSGEHSFEHRMEALEAFFVRWVAGPAMRAYGKNRKLATQKTGQIGAKTGGITPGGAVVNGDNDIGQFHQSLLLTRPNYSPPVKEP